MCQRPRGWVDRAKVASDREAVRLSTVVKMDAVNTRLFKMDYSADGDRWFLGTVTVDGQYIVANTFRRGEQWSGGIPMFPVDEDGPPVDVSFTAHGEPIVTQSIGALIEQLAPGQVQRIPVMIEGGPPGIEPREVLNALACVPCLDTSRSYTLPDPSRPGHYRSVANLHLRAEATGGLDVFRVDEWSVALIVREKIKEALERVKATGLRFKEVT